LAEVAASWLYQKASIGQVPVVGAPEYRLPLTFLT